MRGIQSASPFVSMKQSKKKKKKDDVSVIKGSRPLLCVVKLITAGLHKFIVSLSAAPHSLVI